MAGRLLYANAVRWTSDVAAFKVGSLRRLCSKTRPPPPGPSSAERLLGNQEHEFSVSRSRDISASRVTELSGQDAAGSERSPQDAHVEVYDSNGSVSLHACMQSTVPKPFDAQNKAPTHMNMPQGGRIRLEKYLYSRIKQTHPSRNASTGGAVAQSGLGGPQGIQGEAESATFRLWLECCSNEGNEYCQEQVDHVTAGRKTLAQVFAEIDRMLKDDPASLSGVVASPQGIQADERPHFQLWLENCVHSDGHKDFWHDLSLNSPGSAPGVSQRRNLSVAASESEPDGPLTQRQRLKRAVKVYGSTVIAFHVTISLASLAGFYFAVSSGLDVVALLSKLGVDQSIVQSKMATGASTFVLAYAVHKVFAPVRIAITLTSTPLIVQYLRRVGFLKHPAATKSAK